MARMNHGKRSLFVRRSLALVVAILGAGAQQACMGTDDNGQIGVRSRTDSATVSTYARECRYCIIISIIPVAST